MTDSPVRYPGESSEYRAARNRLLQAEIELRQKTEDVAALRRELPAGGPVATDYEFTEIDADGRPRATRLSQLFSEGKDTLFIYGLMLHPDEEMACPMCTSMLDGLDRQAPYISERINLAVVAKAPIEKILAWADHRGWRNLRLLSSFGSDFNRDYHTENESGAQMPMANVFRRTADGIRHWYGSELLFAPKENMDPRHVDTMWPLWGVLDMTPEGRGADWYPPRLEIR